MVSYSGKNARKDAYDREEAINKLLSKLKKKSQNPKELISNFGYKKYLKITGSTKIEIDEAKIEEAKKWDGIHGVITNNKSLTAKEVIEQYHGLWQV